MPSHYIIDAHTHVFPTELGKDPRAWAAARNESYWAGLVAPNGHSSIQDWADPQDMLDAMDAQGIQRAVLLGWYWQNEDTCRWHNQVIAEWVVHAPDRFIGFASILPNENTLSQLEFAHSLGLRGVGELHIGVQNFDAENPAWRILADWCTHHHWPVNLHATEAAGHPHPGSDPATPLKEFVHLAESTPELKIILAHWGGGLPFFESNPQLRKSLRNVYYDCSASPLLYKPNIFRRVADLVGHEKILFGSDFPLRLYPAKQKQAGYREFLEDIRKNSRLKQNELQALFADNLCKLLGES
ncbi:MAG: amidohydrolase family protein [Coraliomargaritaceae bacterium]